MKSIGKRYHGQQYNHTDMCDYCGMWFQRTDLVLDADQLLRCPNDIDGLTLLELSEQSAQAVTEIEPIRPKTREVP